MKKNIKIVIPIILITIFLIVGSIYAYKFYSKPIGESVHCYYYFDGSRVDDYYYLNDGYLKSAYHVLDVNYPIDQDKMYKLTNKMNNDYKWQLYNMAQDKEVAIETSYFLYDMIKDVDFMELNPLIKKDEGKQLTKEDFKVTEGIDFKYHCDWNAF